MHVDPDIFPQDSTSPDLSTEHFPRLSVGQFLPLTFPPRQFPRIFVLPICVPASSDSQPRGYLFIECVLLYTVSMVHVCAIWLCCVC